jgi:hypothetical protein
MNAKRLAAPIFVAEGSDVMVFRDIAAAERKLEAIDVDDGIFEGWDADGRMLEFVTTPAHGELGLRAVTVAPKAPGATDANGLRERLASVLQTYANRETTGLPLAELVRQFVDWAGYTR